MHTPKRDFNYQLLQMHPQTSQDWDLSILELHPKDQFQRRNFLQKSLCARNYRTKKTLESLLLIRYALLAEKTKRILSNLTYCAPTTSLAFSYYSAKEQNCIFSQRSSNLLLTVFFVSLANFCHPPVFTEIYKFSFGYIDGNVRKYTHCESLTS